MKAPGLPAITFSFHDGATIPGGMVRTILVKQVGLDEEQARRLIYLPRNNSMSG